MNILFHQENEHEVDQMQMIKSLHGNKGHYILSANNWNNFPLGSH